MICVKHGPKLWNETAQVYLVRVQLRVLGMFFGVFVNLIFAGGKVYVALHIGAAASNKSRCIHNGCKKLQGIQAVSALRDEDNVFIS